MSIPRNLDVPELTPEQIQIITKTVFLPAEKLEKADLIFVFGGSHSVLWESAAKLYHQGYAKKIIVTGGLKPIALKHKSWQYGDRTEADVISQKLVENGVPKKAIIIEDKAVNSYENVIFVKELFDFSKISSLMMVCKSYAAGRQFRTLKKNLSENVTIQIYQFDSCRPGNGSQVITKDNWFKFSDGRSLVLGEYLKILLYGKRGHLMDDAIKVKGLESFYKEYEIE